MKRIIILLLLLVPLGLRAQESITYTPLAVTITGYGPTIKYAPGVDATTDSVWTYLLAHNTIAGADVWQAQKTTPTGLVAQFKRSSDALWPYKVAAGFVSASATSSGAVIGLTSGGTGAVTFSGAQNAIGLYPVVMTADSSITVQTLTGLPLQFAVGASQTWQYELGVYDSSSSAAGLKFGFAIPTSSTIVSLGTGQTTGVTASTFDIITATATAGAANATAGGYAMYVARGTVTTGATAGNVILEFLKVTSGTAIVKAGSYLVARRVL